MSVKPNFKTKTFTLDSSGVAVIRTPQRIRSFVFFNNASHTTTIFLGGSAQNPDGAAIPASTSLKLDSFDLSGIDFIEVQFKGTAADTGTFVWIEGPDPLVSLALFARR